MVDPVRVIAIAIGVVLTACSGTSSKPIKLDGGPMWSYDLALIADFASPPPRDFAGTIDLNTADLSIPDLAPACGAVGQACCGGDLATTCNNPANELCDRTNKCVYCGGAAEPCCAMLSVGAPVCGQGLSCQSNGTCL